MCTKFVPMAENEYIHFRIPKVMSEMLNKMSFDTGMSKQEIIRQMIYKAIEQKYQKNPITQIEEIQKQIINETTGNFPR